MSCPDATPDADVLEINRLEREAKIAAERVVDAKNEKYIASTKFWDDIDELYKACVERGKAKTLEDKIVASIKGANETRRNYVESLWNDRKGC